MKTNKLFMVAIVATALLMSACGSQKKYMRTAFDLIKLTFPDARTSMTGDNKVKVIFPQNDMFDVGSSVLKPKFEGRVTKFAEILNKYLETKLNITGHTDNTGNHDSNMQLSKDRALHVQESLVGHGVDDTRMAHFGLGDTQPIADNNTDAGKAENRRVEFELYYAK